MLLLVDRDLNDASVETLSTDRRFMIAYGTALLLATMPLYCSGYETHGSGHHWITFQTLPLAMGSEYKELSSYFDACRIKRNISVYDRSGRISESEVKELMTEVETFKIKVESGLRSNHPDLIGLSS